MEIYTKEEALRQTFVALVCRIERIDDALIIALADDPKAPQQGIELQQNSASDPEDRNLGMESYCVVDARGETYYGGIEWCEFDEYSLRLQFSREAAETFVCAGYDIVLTQLTPKERSDLRSALRELFSAAPEAAHWDL
jgi:hypothetical protein